MLIGEIEGSVTTSGFTFRAYKEIRKFDFVAVKSGEDEEDEEEKWILAQVDKVKKHPDGKTEGEAKIIGYKEKGMLKKPRHVIKPESMVYKADQELITEMLGLDQEGLYIGRLETNPDISINLDPDNLFKHIAVLAKTGFGKSYTLGVLVEELLEKDYPVIVVDPHGEYRTLSESNDISDEDREKYGIEPDSFTVKEYSPNIDINKKAENLTFSSLNLEASEIREMLTTSLTNSQYGVLYTAIKNLKDEDSYSLDQIITQCMNAESKAKWNLVNYLENMKDSGLFSEDFVEMKSLVNEGEASVINLRGVDPKNQEIVVYKLAKELFQLRKIGKVPPFFLILEEAHNFVPEKNLGKALCSDILANIASEGRKFGLGIGVISQRPARIDKNVLSQCNLQIIMRVTNPNDLSAISNSFEGVTSEVKDSITGLPPGVGLTLGKNYPIMVQIRTRKTKHGGGMNESSRNNDFRSIESFKTDLDLNIPEDTKKVFYPLWLIKTSDGKKFVVDASDGEIKFEKDVVSESEEKLLKMIKIKLRDKSELLEKTDLSFSRIESLLNSLKNKNLIARIEDEEGNEKFKAEDDLFDREIVELDVDEEEVTVIEPKYSEDKAIELVKDSFEGQVTDKQLVHHPYHTTGDIVYNGLTGEKI